MVTALGVAAPAPASTATYSLKIVPWGPDAEPALRLRYRVFAEEMGAVLTSVDGLDRDEWDPHCEHLIVSDERTGEVVGTYRIFAPEAAQRLGRSYSATEFDMTRLSTLEGGLVEVGRSCVDPAHRNGVVVSLLWSGLARYMLRSGHRYLGGCASIPLRDGLPNAAAVVRDALAGHRGPESLEVIPHTPWPYADLADPDAVRVPPLLRAYLKLGAQVLGEPAYDADFQTADLYVLLDLHALDERVSRRLLT